MIAFLFILIAFLCGSLPFSVWLGKGLLHLDVRQFGDGNPGAFNVFRAGNKLPGFVALILDVSKAAAPVGLAYFTMGVRGVPMFFISVAPILGHAFSPFLGFKGGKALATALGVWIGLTLWKASLVGVVGALIGIAIFTASGWAVMLALTGILLAILLWIPNPLLLWVLISETLILVWTHHADLSSWPRLRPWLVQRFFRARN